LASKDSASWSFAWIRAYMSADVYEYMDKYAKTIILDCDDDDDDDGSQ
jgi:hypothetical protein